MAKKKKSNVTLEPQIEVGNLEPKPVEEAHIKIAKTIEEKVQPALIVSRRNYPITVKYDRSIIRLSPRSKEKVADLSKLRLTDKQKAEVLIKKL